MVARSRGLGAFFVAGSSSATLGEGARRLRRRRATRSDDARRDADDRTREMLDGGGIATRAAPAGRGGSRGEARRDARACAAAGGRAEGIDAARATERTIMAPALSGYGEKQDSWRCARLQQLPGQRIFIVAGSCLRVDDVAYVDYP